jgi:hypothetical protein
MVSAGVCAASRRSVALSAIRAFAVTLPVPGDQVPVWIQESALQGDGEERRPSILVDWINESVSGEEENHDLTGEICPPCAPSGAFEAERSQKGGEKRKI